MTERDSKPTLETEIKHVMIINDDETKINESSNEPQKSPKEKAFSKNSIELLLYQKMKEITANC